MGDRIKGILCTVVAGIIVFYVQGILSKDNNKSSIEGAFSSAYHNLIRKSSPPTVPPASSTVAPSESHAHPVAPPIAAVPPESSLSQPTAKKLPIEEDINDAIRKYDQGQYDVAIVKLEMVLRKDSGNQQATKYLKLAREQKQKAHDQFMKNIESTPFTSSSEK
jgi:hypothetical protein